MRVCACVRVVCVSVSVCAIAKIVVTKNSEVEMSIDFPFVMDLNAAFGGRTTKSEESFRNEYLLCPVFFLFFLSFMSHLCKPAKGAGGHQGQSKSDHVDPGMVCPK